MKWFWKSGNSISFETEDQSLLDWIEEQGGEISVGPEDELIAEFPSETVTNVFSWFRTSHRNRFEK